MEISKRPGFYIVESKERPFHRFTSNFPNRNSIWQKLNMESTHQKIPGFKDWGSGEHALVTSQRQISENLMYQELSII